MLPRLNCRFNDAQMQPVLSIGSATFLVPRLLFQALALYFPVCIQAASVPYLLPIAAEQKESLRLNIALDYPEQVPLALRVDPAQAGQGEVQLMSRAQFSLVKDFWISAGKNWQTLVPVAYFSLVRRWALLLALVAMSGVTVAAYREPVGLAPVLSIRTPQASYPQQRARLLAQLRASMQALESLPEGSVLQSGSFDYKTGAVQLKLISPKPAVLIHWAQQQQWQLKQSQQLDEGWWQLELAKDQLTVDAPVPSYPAAAPSLAAFSQRWLGRVGRMDVTPAQVQLVTELGLDLLPQLAQDFPGLLLRWDFQAETALSHTLIFQSCNGTNAHVPS